MIAGTYVFAFVVMLSVLIFVHELGHFLVAKLCGVRVLKFSLGFGPPVGIGRFRLAWTRGHTEYVVAWFPLGGFVKMLGEHSAETEAEEAITHAHPEETLGAKPVWQKLAIVFAGPAMNLLLPVVVFAATLAVGLPRPDAVIGTVEEGSPALEAGLAPGDRITAIDGEPLRWWGDVEDAVRERPGATLRVAYERAGAADEVALAVASRTGLDEFGKVEAIGWAGLGHRRLAAMLGIPQGDAPAARAGLRSGDLVRAVAGDPVEDWHGFSEAYAAAAGPSADSRVALTVDRAGAPAEGEPAGEADPTSTAVESLEVEVPALGSVEALGVVPANVLIAGVTPDSPAERGGLAPGDLIVAVDGDPVGSFASFAELVRSSEGRTLDLAIARRGELRRVAIAPELIPTDVGLGIEEPRYLVGITAEPATLQGSVGLDREPNPLVAVPRALQMTLEVTQMFLRGLVKIVTGEVSRSQLAGPIGIAQIAGNALQRGWETYLSTLVLISINLGILNLLPIPILDGGQALIFAVEGIKGAPLSMRTREAVQRFGLTLVVLLMGLAFWNDISRHWSKVLDWLRSGSGL